MHTIARRLDKNCSDIDKDTRRTALRGFALLQNSISIKEVSKVYQNLYRLFNKRYCDNMLDDCVEEMKAVNLEKENEERKTIILTSPMIKKKEKELKQWPIDKNP